MNKDRHSSNPARKVTKGVFFSSFILHPSSFIPVLLAVLLTCVCGVPPADDALSEAVRPATPGHIAVFPDFPEAPVPALAGFVYIDSASVDPLRRIGAPLVLIDQLYDLTVPITRGPDGALQAGLSALDNPLDMIRQSGARPVMTLDFTPAALSPYPYLENSERRSVPPTSYAEWERLIYETARYVRHTPGADVAYWSVWNEPDLAMFWKVDPRRYTRWVAAARDPALWTPVRQWQAAPGAFRDLARRIEYATLYETTARAVKRADPAARVGGPNLSFFNREWLAAFLNHCAERRIPVDFVSWHYPADTEELQTSVKWLKDWTTRRGMPTPPLLITEWYAKVPEGADAWTEAMETLDIAKGYAEAGIEAALYYNTGRIADRKTGALTPIGIGFQGLAALKGRRIGSAAPPGAQSLAAMDGAGRLTLLFWTREALPAPVTLDLPDGRFTSCSVILHYPDGRVFSGVYPLKPGHPPLLDLTRSGGCIGVVVYTP